MIHRLIVLLGALFLTATASAQPVDDWVLAQRDKDAIGVIEVRIGSANLPIDYSTKGERGTGVIISGTGHVLTAAHILSAKEFAICAQADGISGSQRCSISFLWRGDRAKSFEMTVASTRPADRDYIVLKLPPAAGAINRPTWPLATLARRAIDGEAIYATGYPGADEIGTGTENAIDTSRGSLRADRAASCDETYGFARNATAVTAPGLSGGPTFNGLHRVIGIVLGQTCSQNSGSVNDDALPHSRILLVQDMTDLCSNPGFRCFYGYDGDIDPAPASDSGPWYKRLVSGEAVADQYIYGWKLREVARLTNYTMLCFMLQTDLQLVQDIEADANDGSQLATVYAAFWSGCRPGASPADVVASRERVERLANAGYEPAQYLAAALLMNDLAPKLGVRRLPTDPVLLSLSEKEKRDRAETFYRAAARHGWSAAATALVNLCVARVYTCTPAETNTFLDQALADGQWDALRAAGVAYLIGDTADAVARFGFSRPQDTDRALALLQQAATPVAGASKNPTVTSYDNVSAGYLAYFNYGGLYRGRSLLPPNPVAAQGYSRACLGGGFGMNAISEFCGMIDQVGLFNTTRDATLRASAWTVIQQFIPWAPTAGPLARNLSSWSKDGTDITHISCDLDETLQFKAPPKRPTIENGIAYCYFPKLGAAVSQDIFLIDSEGRKMINQMDANLEDVMYPTKQLRPQLKNWIKEAGNLGAGKPAVVVIHLHSLRPYFTQGSAEERYRSSEMSLLDGLGYIHDLSPATRFVVWSQSFGQMAGQDSAAILQRAADGLIREAPARRSSLQEVLNQTITLPWPEPPQERDYGRLRASIDAALVAARR